MHNKGFFWILVVCLIVFLVFGALFFTANITPNNSSKIGFTPQQKKLYLIGGDNNPINVLATTLPQFALNLADEKFKNLWQAQAAGRDSLVQSDAKNAKGDTNLQIQTQFDETRKQMTLTPMVENRVKPGLYRLNVRIKTVQGVETTITQDFAWGVLAINTSKGIYKPGENVEIGMAVLDDYGRTKCILKDGQTMVVNTARIWLTITKPSGQEEHLSTDDKTIAGSQECLDRNFTNKPDFLGKMQATEVGKYKIHMESETNMGKRSIDDYFKVEKSVPFDIQRVIYPTRIYPRFLYPVTIRVAANENYSGKAFDAVPSNFQISEVSDSGTVITQGNLKIIEWNVNLKKGDSTLFQYTIKFPQISPEFYLMGPFTVGQFNEGRSWQVASDSLFALVQEVHIVSNNITTIGTSFANGVQLNNLIVANCMKQNTSNRWGNGTGGWTRAIRNASTGSTQVAQFYRVVNGTTTTAGTKAFSCISTTNTVEIAAEFMEFSGTSTSSNVDSAVAGVRTGRTCNTNNTTNNIYTTPSTNNPDDLLVSISMSNAPSLTVSGHTTIAGASSTGFTDADNTDTTPFNTLDGFYRTSGTGTYDGAYGEIVNTPQVQQTETTSFSGSGTCVIGAVAYNAAITVSQGSYRFFAQESALQPSTPLAATNSAITLNAPGEKFRFRILLDVDSVAGSIAIDSGDWTLGYAIMPSSNNCSDAASTDYTQVTNPVSTNNPAIAFYDEPSLTLAASIASSGNDPSDGPTYTTVMENFFDDDNNAGTPPDVYNHQTAIANNQAGLFDISLLDNTDDSSSHTYCLAMLDGGGNFISAYRNYPTVTTIVNDVVLRSGSTIQGGTTLQ